MPSPQEAPTTLVFPPLWSTIDTPPLGPAVLVKALRSQGRRADFVDLNLGFHQWLYSDETLHDLAGIPVDSGTQDARAWLDRLIAMAPLARPAAEERHAALLFLSKSLGMQATPLLGAGRFLTCVDSSKVTMADLVALRVRAEVVEFWQRWLEPHLTRIAETKPAVVGITIGYVAQVLPAIAIAHGLRQMMETPPTLIAGGPYCTFMTISGVDLSPLFDVFDALGVGPGEDAIVAAAEAMAGDARALPTDMPGLWVAGQERPGLGKPVPQGPDFSDFPLEDYFGLGPATFPLETSRGCWARCRYCNAMSLSKGYRVKRLDQVLEEIGEVQDRFPGARITFVDAVIAPKRAIALAKAVGELAEERAHPIEWRCCLRPDARLDAEQSAALRAGGAYWIFIGFDAATDDLLREIDKRTTLEEIRELVGNLQGAGIVVAGNFILGLPGAGAPDQHAILDFVKELGLDEKEITTSIFGLVRGSWYYEHIDEMGWPETWVARVKANDVLTDFLPTPPIDVSKRKTPLFQIRRRPDSVAPSRPDE